jgi:hypothetical protein
LALNVRPRTALRTGLGLVWAAVWIGLAIAFVVAIGRRSKTSNGWRTLAWAMTVLGIARFLVFPGQAVVSWLGLAAFVAGACALGLQKAHSEGAAAA